MNTVMNTPLAAKPGPTAVKLDAVFKAAGYGKRHLDEFLAMLDRPGFKWIKPAKDIESGGEQLIFAARFAVLLLKRGFSVSQVASAFERIGKVSGPSRIAAIKKTVEVGGKFDKYLAAIGRGGSALDAVFLYVDLNDAVSRQDWPLATRTIYKFMAGKINFIAGTLDALQGLLEALVPERSQKVSGLFKIIRSCDLGGLGAAGVDSMTVLVMAAFDTMRGKPFDEVRFSQLVKRLHSGPTAIFADLGDNIGDVLFDLSRMQANDWYALGKKPLPDLHSYIRSFGK